MYPEFVIGYVLMSILAVMLVAVIVLLLIVLKKLSQVGTRPQATSYSPYSMGNAYAGNRNTAICRNCATQFDSTHTVCPKCGTPR